MGIPTNKPPTVTTRNHKVGGDNVIQLFPSKPRQTTKRKSEDELKQLQKLLRYHHKLIKDAMEQLAHYQLQCAKTEDDYDEALVAYADRIAPEQPDTIHMNYGSHVKPVIRDGKMVLEIE